MDFGLSETQKILQDAVARFGQNQCTLAALRQPRKFNELQTDFDQLGMSGLLIPESFGGQSGLERGQLLDAVCVQEQLGYFVAPIDFMTDSVLFPLALLEAGSPTQQRAFFPELIKGNISCGLALNALEGAGGDSGVYMEQNRLRGKNFLAMEIGDNSPLTHCLTADQSGTLYIIPADQFTLKPTDTIDTTRHFSTIIFNNAQGEKLTEGNQSGGKAYRVLAAARILLAADMVGAAQAMLDKAVAYAKQREQFGRVIGSFQAVKHLCAEMAARLEPCRSLLWYAAHSFDHLPEEAMTNACLTKAHVSLVARFVARSAIEVYGGMGFTEESGMHFWFKRIGADVQLLGGPDLLYEKAAETQFGEIKNLS